MSDTPIQKQFVITVASDVAYEDIAFLESAFRELLTGPPLMGRGLRYWQDREARAVAHRSIAARIRRTPLWLGSRRREAGRRATNVGRAIRGWDPEDYL